MQLLHRPLEALNLTYYFACSSMCPNVQAWLVMVWWKSFNFWMNRMEIQIVSGSMVLAEWLSIILILSTLSCANVTHKLKKMDVHFSTTIESMKCSTLMMNALLMLMSALCAKTWGWYLIVQGMTVGKRSTAGAKAGGVEAACSALLDAKTVVAALVQRI